MLKIYQKTMLLMVMLLTSFSIMASNLAAVPMLHSPVMDTAQMMSPQARQELDHHLRQYSQTSGSQIVVLTVPTIAPESPFDYATRVMRSWELGRSQYSDGVLLLLVRDERKTHLAVGRGLEGAIPDVYAKRLLQDVLRPYLRQGKIDEGIRETVAQTQQLIAGERLPENTSSRQSHHEHDSEDTLGLLVMGLVFSTILGGMLRGMFGHTKGSLATGGIIALGAWWLSGLLWVGLIFGVIAYVIALITGSRAFISHAGGGSWQGNGGFHSGGFGHGDRSRHDTHDHFNNFGGGGGSFGGGGASGDW